MRETRKRRIQKARVVVMRAKKARGREKTRRRGALRADVSQAIFAVAECCDGEDGKEDKALWLHGTGRMLCLHREA